MFGRIVFSETKKVTQRREELEGIPVQTVYVPARAPTRRRIRKAALLLRRSGVHRTLAPPDFSDWPQLERFGVLPVDTVPFLQSMALPLTLSALAGSGVHPEHAVVLLAGRRASKAFCDAAVALCPRIQQIVISAPSGGAGLADYLRREYGLPVLQHSRAPHLILLFSAAELDSKAPTFRLYSPAPELLGYSIRPKTIPLPNGCEVLPFLAVLWESGRLTVSDIEVFPCEDT